MTGNALARTQGSSLTDKLQYAKALASANLLPRQYQSNPGNVLFALEYADALGVSPIHAITAIHVIEGKPSASADLIASLVRRAGHKLRVSGDDTKARAVIIRADDPDFEYVSEWDMDKARRANLTGKGVWKSYPGAMLRARAITEVARMGASDALYGVIYTPEELGVNVDADGQPVDLGEQPATAQSVPQPQQGGSAVSRLAAAAAQPVDQQTGDSAAEIDWIAELEAAGDDVDAIRAIYRRAKSLRAEDWVIEAINAAGAAAKEAQPAVTVDGEIVEEAAEA
jgi:hypothetical protein